MTDVRLYLVETENNNKAEATTIAAGAAQRLQSKELSLLQLIESLGEYINHEDALKRERTMSFLAEVLESTPNGVLSGQHRSLLLDFVLSRIEDHEVGVGSCTKALLALEERGKWDGEKAKKVMTALIDNTHPLIKNGSQSQRYPVLLLIDLLLAKYRGAIQALHQADPGFLHKFVAYFDGEKDPRNLMIVFSIITVVGTEWDISSSVQELFDASFNYFPITFRPPPDDAYRITAQDLKDRLRGCIASNSSFAPYAYPALLDKLDSTSVNTKRDVLQAIQSTLLTYGPKTVALYAVTLWDAVKFEILQVQEEDIAQESLEVLAHLAVSLTRGSKSGLFEYLKPVVKECNEHLEDAPTKQSDAASRILYSICARSASASHYILGGVLPHLFKLYQSTQDVQKKRSLVQILAKLVEANCKVFGTWQTLPDQLEKSGNGPVEYGRAAENVLKESSDQTFEVLTTALASTPITAVSFRLSLLEGLVQLSKAREILRDDNVTKLIQLLNGIILDEEAYGKDEVKVAATDGLVEIAHQKPQLIIDHSFPIFLSKLPDTDAGYQEHYIPVLEAFSKLAVEGQIFNTIIVRLKNKLNAAIYQGASSRYTQAILSAILFAFRNTSFPLQGDQSSCPYYLDVIHPLLTQTVAQLGQDRQDDAVYGLLGQIASEVLRLQTVEFQNSISDQIFILSIGRALSEIPPINAKASSNECKHLLISVHLLGALRRTANFPYDTEILIRSLITLSFRDDLSIGSKAAALQQISLLINKFISNADLKQKLKPLLDETLFTNDSQTLSLDAIRVAFAVLKSLILRNSPILNVIYPILLDALPDESVGLSIAHGFSTLLQPDSILTKPNHCVISALHAQKTFATLVPAISTRFKAASAPAAKRNHLIALAGILRWLPFAIIADSIPALSPLLLQTLDMPGSHDIKAGTVAQLAAILREDGAALEEHASSLVARLLTIATAADGPAALRASALQCLALVAAQFRTEVVLPYRRQVVKRLEGALDDRKRSVRAEAVRARMRWIEVDEPEAEDA